MNIEIFPYWQWLSIWEKTTREWRAWDTSIWDFNGIFCGFTSWWANKCNAKTI